MVTWAPGLDLQLVLYCLLIGSAIGFLAGLLGIGGGMLMVPFMMHLLATRGIGPAYLVKVAIATSLTTILFTSLSSVRAHHRAGAVRWDLAATLAPGIVAGALIGSQFVGVAPARWMEIGFGVFLIYTALSMLRQNRASAPVKADVPLPPRGRLFAFGAVVGGVSSMVGAGGGFLTIPYLNKRGVRLQSAVATSAACGFPIALGGALGYVWAGRHLDLGAGMLGYLYLPALLLMSLASVSTAPMGARVAHRTNTAVLKQILALSLLTLGLYMFVRSMLH